MSLRDLFDLVNKEKRERSKVKAAQKIAVGVSIAATVGIATGILLAPKAGKETREDIKKKVGDTVETIKDTVHKKVDAVKETTTQAAQDVNHAIHGVHGKGLRIKKDMKDGLHNIEQDIEKTAEKISDEINNPVK